jgi:hypothetical protein
MTATLASANAMIADLEEVLEQLVEGVEIPVYGADGKRCGSRRTPGIGELFRLNALSRSDGYRRSTRPGTGGSSSGEVSDPTFAMATANVSDVHRHVQTVIRSLFGALCDGKAALDALVKAFPEAAENDGPGEPGCVSCARHTWEPRVYRSKRCRFCYDFRLIYRMDPPVDLVKDHHDGKTITEAMRRRSAEAARAQRRSKGKGKRARASVAPS